MKSLLTLFTVLIFNYILIAQDFSVSSIPKELMENAYAVLRNEQITVELLDYDKVVEKKEITVTVLNESGLKYATIPVYYNSSDKIKTYEAMMYKADGSEMKKLKYRDAKDVSVYDGFSLFIDRRVQYFEVIPVSYPFTIHYTIETSSSSTVSLLPWLPAGGYDLSVEKSTYTLINHTTIPIRKFESGFEGWDIHREESANFRTYSAQNIPAIEDEIFSPVLTETTPFVKFALVEFQLEGVKGKFESWQEFGKWYHENLLFDKQDLSEKEKLTAQNLVKDAENEVDKIRILYQYMQTKTRYINVAIGIGGWEPFPASYVSEKSYGDCKALSNYMVSLLDAVGIKAYHTIVFGETERKVDFKVNFASLQGNHMIVNVPVENDTVWLECTSQQTAFNYLGQFTDGRLALSVSPEGGKIVKTQNFNANDNRETNKGKGQLLSNGDLKANFSIQNTGLEYDLVYRADFQNQQNQKIFLNNWLSDLPNLKINQYEFQNDRNNAVFQTNMEIESKQFAKVFGNNMTLNIVPVTRLKSSFKKDNNRNFPFDIRFGYNHEIEFELKIPHGFKMTEKFEPLLYVSEFGNYTLSVEEVSPDKILVKRSVLIKDGTYNKEKFNDFVEFRRKISSFDNTKILLEKI